MRWQVESSLDAVRAVLREVHPCAAAKPARLRLGQLRPTHRRVLMCDPARAPALWPASCANCHVYACPCSEYDRRDRDYDRRDHDRRDDRRDDRRERDHGRRDERRRSRSRSRWAHRVAVSVVKEQPSWALWCTCTVQLRGPAVLAERPAVRGLLPPAGAASEGAVRAAPCPTAGTGTAAAAGTFATCSGTGPPPLTPTRPGSGRPTPEGRRSRQQCPLVLPAGPSAQPGCLAVAGSCKRFLRCRTACMHRAHPTSATPPRVQQRLHLAARLSALLRPGSVFSPCMLSAPPCSQTASTRLSQPDGDLLAYACLDRNGACYTDCILQKTSQG